MTLNIGRPSIHLVWSQAMLELSRVWQRQLLTCLTLQDVYCETRVLDGRKKSVQLEVTDVLGSRRHDIGRVKVVPDIINFSNRHPVVTLVREEALFLSEWLGGLGGRLDGHALDVLSKVCDCSRNDLN